MKGMRIGAIGIIFIVMLMSVSIVYSQVDPALMVKLEKERNNLTAEMNAEILIKESFGKLGATKVCTATECTWTGADGRILKEVYDKDGNLLMDVFTDPKFKMELTTEYTINQGVICRILLNIDKQLRLKLCNPCPLVESNQTATKTYGAFQDQFFIDVITGDALQIKANCCGAALTKGYCDSKTSKCEY
jgi:hypothetical protein